MSRLCVRNSSLIFRRPFSIDQVVKAIVHPKGEDQQQQQSQPLPSQLEIPPRTVPFPTFTVPDDIETTQQATTNPSITKKQRDDLSFHLLRYIINTRPQVDLGTVNDWIHSQVTKFQHQISPSQFPKSKQELLRFYREDSKTQSMSLSWKSWWSITNSDKYSYGLYDSFSGVKSTPKEKVYSFELPFVDNPDMLVEVDTDYQLKRLGNLATLKFGGGKGRYLASSANSKKVVAFNYGWNNITKIGLRRTMGVLSLEKSDEELRQWWRSLGPVKSHKLQPVTLKHHAQFPTELASLTIDEDLIAKIQMIPWFEVEVIGEHFLNLVGAKYTAMNPRQSLEVFKHNVTDFITTKLQSNDIKLPIETHQNRATAMAYIALSSLQDPQLTEDFLKQFINVVDHDVWPERIKWTMYENQLPIYNMKGIKDIESIFRLPPIPRTSVASTLMTNKNTVNKSRYKALLEDGYSLGHSSYEFNLRRFLIQNLPLETIELNFPRLLALFRHHLFYRHVIREQFERIEAKEYRKLLIKHRFEGGVVPAQFMQIMAILTLYDNQVPNWLNQFIPIMCELYGTLSETDSNLLNKELLQEFKNEPYILSTWSLNNVGSATPATQQFERNIDGIARETYKCSLSNERLRQLGKLYWEVMGLILNMKLDISGFVESNKEVSLLLNDTLLTKIGHILQDELKPDTLIGQCLSVDDKVALNGISTTYLESCIGHKFELYDPSIRQFGDIVNEVITDTHDILSIPVIAHTPPLSTLLQVNYNISRDYLKATTKLSIKQCLQMGDIISKMSSFGEAYLRYRLEKNLGGTTNDELYGSVKSLFQDKQFRKLIVEHSPGYSKLETTEQYRLLKLKATRNPYDDLRYYNWQFRQLIASVIYYDPLRFDSWLQHLVDHILSTKDHPLSSIQAFRSKHGLSEQWTDK